MARLKDATFQSGSVTGSDGFTSVSGATLDTNSKIKGTGSGRTNWTGTTNVTGTISGLSETELFISLYWRWESLPTSGSPRIWSTSNGSTQWNITVNSSGQLNMRIGGTTIASNFLTVSLNTNYRIGIRIKNSTALANADAETELWARTDDGAFTGSDRLVNHTTGTMASSNAAIVSFTCGQNNASGGPGDIYWDNIRVDDAAMPTDDVTGGDVLLGASGSIAITGSAGLIAPVLLGASGSMAITGSAGMSVSSSVLLGASGTIAITGSAALNGGLGASGTIAITGSAGLTRTGGGGGLGASGTIAITGSAGLSIVAAAGWNWTRFKRPLIDRYLNVTIAATAGTGYLGVTKDGSTYRWFSGPLAADGRTLTEVADEAAAKAAAIALPTAGVWSLPTTIEARWFKLGHKGAGTAYTIHEFYPRRLVEADDIRAETIRAIHIAAGTITGDRLIATAIDGFLITGATIQTAASGERIVMNASNFTSYNSGGVAQVTIAGGNGGKLTAGGGAVVLSSDGLAFNGSATDPTGYIRYYAPSDGGRQIYEVRSYYNAAVDTYQISGISAAGRTSVFHLWSTDINIQSMTGTPSIQMRQATNKITMNTLVIGPTSIASPGSFNLLVDGFVYLGSGSVVSLSYNTNNGYNNVYTNGSFNAGGAVIANNWFRSISNSGWYNETHGGGIWMNDSTWVRVYNSKAFVVNNILQAEYSAPELRLNNTGSGARSSVRFFNAGTARWQIGNDFQVNGTNDFYIYDDTNGAGRLHIGAAGNVLIPQKIYVGAVYGSVPGWTIHSAVDSCAKPNGGSWTNSSSDIRTKVVLGDYPYGLAEVRRLRLVCYEYNGLGSTVKGLRGYGFVAQDAQQVIPEMVGTRWAKLHEDDAEETELLTLNNDPAIYATMRAAQELAELYDRLAERCERLEAEVAALRKPRKRQNKG